MHHSRQHSSPRRLLLALLCWLACALVGACGQPAGVAVPPTPPPPPVATPGPTVDPLTLNICATCDVQQRRMQATAAAQ